MVKSYAGKGFTLVELLVVIAIISALMGALALGIGGISRTAQKAKAQMKARQQKLLDFIDEHSAVLSRDVSREWAGDMPRTRLKGT